VAMATAAAAAAADGGGGRCGNDNSGAAAATTAVATAAAREAVAAAAIATTAAVGECGIPETKDSRKGMWPLLAFFRPLPLQRECSKGEDMGVGKKG
jgi:hypothetical protein